MPTLPQIPKIQRPPKEIIDALKDIGTATVAGSLGHSGFRNPHMLGPVTQRRGKSIVGPALTANPLTAVTEPASGLVMTTSRNPTVAPEGTVRVSVMFVGLIDTADTPSSAPKLTLAPVWNPVPTIVTVVLPEP